jgi:GTPase SAR1 family protein
MTQPHITFRVAVLGDSKTGKTSLLRRVCTGEYPSARSYVPTREPETDWFAMHVRSAAGVEQELRFSLWELAATTTEWTCCQHMDAAVVCSRVVSPGVDQDIWSANRAAGVERWVRAFRKACGGSFPTEPIYAVFTRTKQQAWLTPDLDELRVKQGLVGASVACPRSYEGTQEPFLAIARTLLEDDTLTVVEMPAVAPPVVSLEPWQLRRYAMMLAAEDRKVARVSVS